MSSGYIQSRDHPSFLSDNLSLYVCMYECMYARVCLHVCIIQREFVYAHVNLWPPVLDSILRNFPAGWCGRPSRTAYVSRCRVCRLSKNDQCNPAIVGGGGDRSGGIVEGGVAKGVKVRFRLLRFQFVMREGEGWRKERERERKG